jgi:dihydroorotase
MRLLLKNGKNLNGSPLELAIDGDRITALAASIDPLGADRLIDLHGCTVIPGLTDMQVHFRDPGFPEKEDLKSGAEAARAGGVTRVLCMANTNPPLDTGPRVRDVLHRALELGLCDTLVCGTLSRGLLGQELTDFQELKDAGAVALTDDGKGVQSDDLMERAFRSAKKVDLPILDHAECDAVNRHGVIGAGSLAEKYGLQSSAPEGEVLHIERGCRLSALTGARYHALHVSTRGGVQAIREAKRAGLPVTGEVCPHHLLLGVQDIPEGPDGLGPDSNFKMNPPLRSRSDQDACIEGLLDGTLDAITTDHAPHTVSEKRLGFADAPFGIVGLETLVPLIYTHFVKKNLLSLERMIELMNEGPCKILGLKPNQVSVGSLANLAWLDLDTSRTVDPRLFRSKSVNTPFSGWKLQGFSGGSLYSGRL